jgi:hypothetical protein
MARAISAYIRLFDRLMKGYLGGDMTAETVRSEYIRWLQAGNIML